MIYIYIYIYIYSILSTANHNHPMVISPPKDNTCSYKYAIYSWALVGMSNCYLNYIPGQDHNIFLIPVIITNLILCLNTIEFSNHINIKVFFILNK